MVLKNINVSNQVELNWDLEGINISGLVDAL